MSQDILQKDISKELGLDYLTEEEQVDLLSEIGDTVLQSALLRLVAEFTPEQTEALDQFLDSDPDADTLMNHLLEHHKNFEQILNEEVVAFKTDALAVLNEK